MSKRQTSYLGSRTFLQGEVVTRVVGKCRECGEWNETLHADGCHEGEGIVRADDCEWNEA